MKLLYQIVQSANLDALAKNVQAQANEGWRPVGGVSFAKGAGKLRDPGSAGGGGQADLWVQAMTKDIAGD